MVPLIVHSYYSLMWGTASISNLCRTARRLGYDRLALTDTDNLYGLWPFLRACRHEGMSSIIGAEITEPGSRRRIVCLVENDHGYRNLCRLLTLRHCSRDFKLNTALADRAAGLTILTGNAVLLQELHGLGIPVAVALPRKPLPAVHPLIQTATALKAPLVAVPESFFLSPKDHNIHRLLRAIAGNASLSCLSADELAPVDAWLAPPKEYARRFAILPEAVKASSRIAERLTFTGPRLGTVMPLWMNTDGADPASCLRNVAYRGAQACYGAELSESVVERLEHELRIIIARGFATYFLVVADIVRQSPRTCGRGSGAASLVAYVLGITNVCPLKHNLYFERFLNPGRTDPPDIDVDFAWDERDTVLKSVLARYHGHAAMVANHVFFQPRMAIRETAKVFGLTESEIGRVARRLPSFWHTDTITPDLLQELKERPRSSGLDFPPPWPEILSLARRIIGTPRYLSVHPGGVIITPRPIDEYVPVEKAAKGVPVIQWEKDSAEDAGLVKIDLLGNRSLGVIRDAIENLKKNGHCLDESTWEPEDDFSTQEEIAQGRTMGCFYIESPAMRILQKKSRTGSFEHLVIHSSIIRPAANEFIREYLRRLHGGSWEPIHPLLKEVLEETFGIMVYQEDVSRVAMALAGFSPAEADALRKVLSKKDREHELQDFRKRFQEGARSHGLADEQITQTWKMMMSFGGYSFCKPHSASYARVSFQAAYLKVHYPAEFMAAVISNRGGFYSTFAYVSEARRMGLRILPPDVNHSEIHWTGAGNSLRVGLISIKGLQAETCDRLLSQRRKSSFSSLPDFLNRVFPAEDEARALLACGALDGFDSTNNRATLMWQLAVWLKTRAQKTARTRSLFENKADPSRTLPRLPPESERNRLRREFAVLGFLCDRHPLEMYKNEPGALPSVKAVDLPRHTGQPISFVGWLLTGKTIKTRQGDPMEFLTFEDETGLVETTFFPEAYRRFAGLLESNRPYLLQGRVEKDWGVVTLNVQNARKL